MTRTPSHMDGLFASRIHAEYLWVHMVEIHARHVHLLQAVADHPVVIAWNMGLVRNIENIHIMLYWSSNGIVTLNLTIITVN